MPILYDLLSHLFSFVISIFFREVRARGTYFIPKYGPVIFVAAPHHNQFVDPIMLLRTVRRRVCFLAAQKTMDRPWVGKFAAALQAIGVTRIQDVACTAPGKIFMPDAINSPLLLHGIGTSFTKLHTFINKSPIGCLIMLKGDVSLEIAKVISDTEIILKRAVQEDNVVQTLSTSNGVGYKIAPKVDHAQLYERVYDHLRWGKCIGIFPEGGSHDRSELLPFKAGVTVMALGAMASTPGLDVKLVPVGLSYFNPDRFRSRAVVEYGQPITIPRELVERYKLGGVAKRDACKALLETVEAAVRSVTVTAPDPATLQLLQTVRRLYRPLNRKLSMVQKLELTRRLTKGFLHYRDDPRIKEIEVKVALYYQLLKYHGLQDHQVERTAIGGVRALVLLLYRLAILTLMALVALPGTLINMPIAIIATHVSKKKAKEALAASTVKLEGKDVLATWKLIVALVLIPVIYIAYTALTFLILYVLNVSRPLIWLAPLLVIMGLPTVSLVALSYGETGADIYKSLPPLFFSILPTRWSQSLTLRQVRRQLSRDVNDIINELGPSLFPDFQTFFLKDTEIPRVKSQEMGLRRVSSWVTGMLTASESFLSWDWDLSQQRDSNNVSPTSSGIDEGVFFFQQQQQQQPFFNAKIDTSINTESRYTTPTTPGKSEVDLTRYFITSPTTASSASSASISEDMHARHSLPIPLQTKPCSSEEDNSDDEGIVVIKSSEASKGISASTIVHRHREDVIGDSN